MDEKRQTCDALFMNGLRIESIGKTFCFRKRGYLGWAGSLAYWTIVTLRGGGGYYEGASFKSPYDISNHWSAQKEASCGRDYPTLLKKITEKYRATSVQQSTNVFNL